MKSNVQVIKSAESNFLPFSLPWFDEEEKQAVAEVLESGWVTTGPRTAEFERNFADYVGAEHAIAINSCTAGLHLALVALDLGPGDAVITTPFTFSATANVIVHVGAEPVFCDIDPQTYNIDPEAIRRTIAQDCDWNSRSRMLRLRDSGAKVRAIMPVHYGGHPCAMEEILAIAEEFNLALVEDAAHALGAKYRGQSVGTFGLFASFSFYATKNLSTGEGGMLTTSDSRLAHKARTLSLHGLSRDAWNRYKATGTWRYDLEQPGYKYNLTDLASAIGIVQLRKQPAFLQRRKQIVELYTKQLSDLSLQLPTVRDEIEHAWHLYPVQVDSWGITRDQMIQALKAAGIGTSVHFIPLHLMSYYRDTYGYGEGAFPVTEAVYGRILSLPFFPKMSDLDVTRTCDAVRDALADHLSVVALAG